MSTGTEWHADERLLAGYVAGQLALPAAMSLEQHVMRCPQCRDALSGQVDPRPLDRVWQGIEARVDGSLRQRWRRLWFRLRQPVPRPGAMIRPDRWPAGGWSACGTALGGMAIAGVALLSVGYLAAGMLALGPARGPVLDRDMGSRSVTLRTDHGMRPGQLPATWGWPLPAGALPDAAPIRGAV